MNRFPVSSRSLTFQEPLRFSSRNWSGSRWPSSDNTASSHRHRLPARADHGGNCSRVYCGCPASLSLPPVEYNPPGELLNRKLVFYSALKQTESDTTTGSRHLGAYEVKRLIGWEVEQVQWKWPIGGRDRVMTSRMLVPAGRRMRKKRKRRFDVRSEMRVNHQDNGWLSYRVSGEKITIHCLSSTKTNCSTLSSNRRPPPAWSSC